MSAQATKMAPITIRRARKIIAEPALFSGNEIIIACGLLFACGSSKDQQAVLALQKDGIVAGFELSRSAMLDVPKGYNRWVGPRLIDVIAAGVLGFGTLTSAYLAKFIKDP